MAAVCFCLGRWILTFLLLASHQHLGDCELNRIKRTPRRTISLSGDLNVMAGSDLFDGEGYMADNPQEKPDPAQLGGIGIQNEANRLAAQLRMLSNQEIGVTDMQVCIDSWPGSVVAQLLLLVCSLAVMIKIPTATVCELYMCISTSVIVHLNTA